jgi:hypothetical protein
MRQISLREILIILVLPVLLGCAALLFRPIAVFYTPGKTWWLMIGLSIVSMMLGWLNGQRLLILVLPTLGLLLSIFLRILLDLIPVGIPFEIQYGTPFLLLVVVLLAYSRQLRQAFPWKKWLPYIIGLPLTGLLIGAVVIITEGALNQNAPLDVLFRGYIYGTFIPMGTLSLLFLIGIPFAYRFGSKAVLLLVGFLFSNLIGLSATLWPDELQRATGGLLLVLLLLIIPLINLNTSSRFFEHLSILLPLTLAYGLLLVMKAISGELALSFTLYTANELLQTLLILAMAIEMYARLKRNINRDREVVAGIELHPTPM